MQEPVIVVEYDPNWEKTFQTLRDGIAPFLNELIVSIEHVGSTSIPGVAAKPIIDIDVVVRSPEDVPRAIERLSILGYTHVGDLGIGDVRLLKVRREAQVITSMSATSTA